MNCKKNEDLTSKFRPVTIVLMSLLILSLSFSAAQVQSQTSYIIVHALNPERVEIASIEGIDSYCVEIYDGDALIGYGAHDNETYNKPIQIPPGAHTIKVKFNGMTLEQDINLELGETKILVFIFARTTFNLIERIGSCYIESSISGGWSGPSSKIYDTKTCSNNPGWKTETHFWEPCYYRSGVYNLKARLSFQISENDISWNNYVYADIDESTYAECPSPHSPSSTPYWHSQASPTTYEDIELETFSPDFDEWYLQYTNFCEGVSLTIDGTEYLGIQGDNIVKTTSANQNSLLEVMWGTYLSVTGYNAYHHFYDGRLHMWNEFEESGGGTFKMLMSSVPYDLTGTGIKYEENQPPVASFTYSPETALTELRRWYSPALIEHKITLTSALIGQEITFDASSSTDPDGEIVSYSWKFGDGNVGEGKVVTHAYTQAGEYNVRLTVMDNDGQAVAVERRIEIYELIPGDLSLGVGSFFVPGYWSHAGMYIGDGQVVESHKQRPRGVDITPLENWFDHYKTWAVLRVVTADEEIRKEAINWATHPDRLDDPYDLMWWQKDPNGEAWYCSELIWAAYLHASNGQINLEYGPDNSGITPDEIFLDDDIQPIAAGREERPQTGIVIMAKSPVDLEVVDPENLFVSKHLIEIPDAIYGEDDIDGDGSPDDWIGIPEPKTGKYLINVIPEPGASLTDTFTTEALLSNTTIVLAEDVQISDIPSKPYVFKSIPGCYLGVYLGCGSEDLSCESISEFNQKMGKRHAIFSRYVDVADSMNTSHFEWAKEVIRNGAMPMFFYDPWNGLDNINTSDVECFASKCKELDRTIFVIFGHEMNGPWYPWGNRPEKYKEKFKEVAEIFHEIAPNVEMCWVPNQNWGYPWGGTDYGDGYSEYYPEGVGTYGEYVDWVGLDFFEKDWDDDNKVPADMFVANIRRGQDDTDFYEMFAVGKNKPMLIAETGAFDPNKDPTAPGERNPLNETEQAEFKNEWLKQVYNASILKSEFPRLNAICYFHVNKTETLYTQSHSFYDIVADYGIPKTPNVYKDFISDSYFIGGTICYDFRPPAGVGVEDIMEVASRWRTSCENPNPDQNDDTPNYDPLYDVDDDCDIDVVDIMKVVVHWGETCW